MQAFELKQKILKQNERKLICRILQIFYLMELFWQFSDEPHLTS